MRLDEALPALPIAGCEIKTASFTAKIAEARNCPLLAGFHEFAVPLARPVEACQDPALLLTAIARARSWMNDLNEGRVNSFEAIARSENKVERHIRRLIPLAFASPRIVEAIANGYAPADLTVTSLTSALPRSWTKQEKRYGIVCPIARRGPEMK